MSQLRITNGCSGSSKSIPSPAPTDSPLSTSESEDGVDLTACSNINFELQDGQAGVRFEDSSNTSSSGWIPVVGRWQAARNVRNNIMMNYLPASY